MTVVMAVAATAEESSSAFSSSIRGTAGASDDRSFRIFLLVPHHTHTHSDRVNTDSYFLMDPDADGSRGYVQIFVCLHARTRSTQLLAILCRFVRIWSRSGV